jgi:methylaspartate ammonia-lyase
VRPLGREASEARVSLVGATGIDPLRRANHLVDRPDRPLSVDRAAACFFDNAAAHRQLPGP